MILVLDIGNTQTVLGVFEGERLLADWRLATQKGHTSDEYGLMVTALLERSMIDKDKLEGIILSSVVPPVTGMFVEMCHRYFHLAPLLVGPGIRTGLAIRYENPKEVGADRVVNAVAAINLYKPPLLIVDFGTATTLCAINEKGEYLGGIIAPGLGIAAEALFMHAAKLPRVELEAPTKVIGRNTINSIQSGLVYGYTDLVDGLIKRAREEMNSEVKVVATGGLAELIVRYSKSIQITNPVLTLQGLRMIYEMNMEKAD